MFFQEQLLKNKDELYSLMIDYVISGPVTKDEFSEGGEVCGLIYSVISGTVTKDEFSEGLQSMRAPFTSNEVHFITSFLTEKPLRLKVDYLVFAKGVNIPFPILDNFTSEVSRIIQ